MGKSTPVVLAAAASFVLVGTLASAQPAPPVKQLPAGFTVVSQTATSTAVSLDATRPNATKPAIAVDADAHLKYVWRPSPGFGRVVEMMAGAPEEPASDQGTIRQEPAGKLRLRGGVLTFRKNTVVQVGTNAAPWVTFDAVWIAAVDNGMLSVSVTNYAGAKTDLQPWIEALIPRPAAR
jgi:hypothetical protein